MKKAYLDQLEIDEISKKKVYFSIIESLLFASGDPLKDKEIASIIECDLETTRNLLEMLKESYESEERGIMLITLNDEYQLVTKAINTNYVQKLLKINTRQSLSQAALETLAIIAYKQPITRINIDEIRGVKSDRAVLTLTEKGLIKEVGRLEVPGRPVLFATTDKFLLHFGLENLEQLPVLDDLASLEIIATEDDNSENETKE
ncbi:SMC-Scp complex subunit ScpB [Candidatus Clostridium radicumherbarum]|uniref:Segregation and condensation protein B n=1 Tax=Candidatus Clostridium radicumherbarum TaxID=3381662 RepID=A0ABW8TSE1_9CLOT